jgi:hypothetical protein
MKRIYFDLTNPALLTWLKTRPIGSYNLLLGCDTPNQAVDILFSKVTAEGRDLVSWLVKKIQQGELQIKANTKIDLPQGVVLE